LLRKKQKQEEAEEKKKSRKEERLSRLSTQVYQRLFKEAYFQRADNKMHSIRHTMHWMQMQHSW